MLRPRPLSTLRIIRVDTRSFEVKAPPLWSFFGIVRPYSFQLDRTAVLFSKLHHTLKLYAFVSETFIWSKGRVLSAFK